MEHVKQAAIDMGTNSFLLTIGDVVDGQVVDVLVDELRIVRLGQEVDQRGTLHPDAKARAFEALEAFRDRCLEVGVAPESVNVVGTSALRDAADRDAFLAEVKARTGFQGRVIAGEQEALCSYRGALSSLALPDDAAPCLLDIGGGSTELVWADGAQRFSLQVGVVRGRERFLLSEPPTPDEVDALDQELRGLLAALPERPDARPLIAVAGTPTTLVAIQKELASYDGAQVHGTRLGIDELATLLERLREMPLAEREKVIGLHPKRADLIVSGGRILLTVMEWLGQTEILVSDRGVRYGLLLEEGR
jgi:exopolyphosphatase/guanosine-5'-triphosphate,3'-diphosphate pyrophosphatase